MYFDEVTDVLKEASSTEIKKIFDDKIDYLKRMTILRNMLSDENFKKDFEEIYNKSSSRLINAQSERVKNNIISKNDSKYSLHPSESMPEVQSKFKEFKNKLDVKDLAFVRSTMSKGVGESDPLEKQIVVKTVHNKMGATEDSRFLNVQERSQESHIAKNFHPTKNAPEDFSNINYYAKFAKPGEVVPAILTKGTGIDAILKDGNNIYLIEKKMSNLSDKIYDVFKKNILDINKLPIKGSKYKAIPVVGYNSPKEGRNNTLKLLKRLSTDSELNRKRFEFLDEFNLQSKMKKINNFVSFGVIDTRSSSKNKDKDTEILNKILKDLEGIISKGIGAE